MNGRFDWRDKKFARFLGYQTNICQICGKKVHFWQCWTLNSYGYGRAFFHITCFNEEKAMFKNNNSST